MTSTERVEKYENYYDEADEAIRELNRALIKYKSAKGKIDLLKEYYNTDWKTDYLSDEQGLFPDNLKRGILSEEAIYELLTSNIAVHQMASLILFKRDKG